jgi:hypothetical protein
MEHRLGAAIAVSACVFLGATACTIGAGAQPSASSDPLPSAASSPATSANPISSTGSEIETSAVSSVAPSSASSASSTRTPTSSQSTVARTSTPTEIAEAQVKAFVPTYFAALDRLQSSLTLPLSELDKYAIDPVEHEQTLPMKGFRANDWVQVGTTRVGHVQITSVDLSGARPTVKATTCVDVTGVKGIDKKTGKDVTVPGRADFFIEHLTVVNIDHLSRSGWRVSNETNKGVKSCAAA